MTPEEVVLANLDAYLRQDRAACEALLGDELAFTSPQDDHIDKAAFLERCFPTADRVSRQEVLHVAQLDERDVFLMYEYDLKSGGTHRNTELITGAAAGKGVATAASRWKRDSHPSRRHRELPWHRPTRTSTSRATARRRSSSTGPSWEVTSPAT